MKAAIGILVKYADAPAGGPSKRISSQWIARWSPPQLSQKEVIILYISLYDLTIERDQLLANGWFADLENDQWLFLENVPLCAIYNRFPRNQDKEGFDQLVQKADQLSIPFGNRPEYQGQVWDKWKTHKLFSDTDLLVPETTNDFHQVLELCDKYNSVYIKPRFGAFGEGIEVLSQKDQQYQIEGDEKQDILHLSKRELKTWLETRQSKEALIFQQGIEPPFRGLRGFCVRSLVQFTSEDGWLSAPRVARLSAQDPVANVARGAQAKPLKDLCNEHWEQKKTQQLLEQMDQFDKDIAKKLIEAQQLKLPQHGLLELGVDYVIDGQGQCWLLEINGFPQGRLEKLSMQFPERFEAHCRAIHHHPLDTLWKWSQKKSL